MSTPSPATAPDASSASLPAVPGYEVMGLVGRGGMGKVYRARHVALGRVVAIKVMTHEQDERLTARFRDEARAVAKLHDVGLADPSPARVAEELAALGLLGYVQNFLPNDWSTTGELKE